MIENFDKLEYARKVDVLVAQHVMGWKDITIIKVGYESVTVKWLCKGTDRFGSTGYIPLYSTLLSSSWDLVRKFDYLYLFRGGEKWKGGKWECKLVWDDENTNLYGWAETECLAICYAGLKAVGFDVKGFLKEEGKA